MLPQMVGSRKVIGFLFNMKDLEDFLEYESLFYRKFWTPPPTIHRLKRAFENPNTWKQAWDIHALHKRMKAEV